VKGAEEARVSKFSAASHPSCVPETEARSRVTVIATGFRFRIVTGIGVQVPTTTPRTLPVTSKTR
jgi:hypothetical protein